MSGNRGPNQTSCSNAWIYNRARPLASWYALKRRQDDFLKLKEESERMHENLKLQHESQWNEQCKLLELELKKPTDRSENDLEFNNNFSCSPDANQKKPVLTKSKKKKFNKKGKKSDEAMKKAEDSDISDKNAESGEKEERDLVEDQECEIKGEVLLNNKETQNKLEKDLSDRLLKLNKQKEKTTQEHLKREQQLEKDRADFMNEFERHVVELDRKSKNMSNIRALRERIHFMEGESNKKDQYLSEMHGYIMDLEAKSRYMSNAISRLQQEVSDFQFEKLQLSNQIVEKDNQLAGIMAMNPHIMMNLQGLTETVYYNCPPDAATGQELVVENIEPPTGASLIDIRDRYDDLLVEFPENDGNEEVNWTLTMISKIVDYYESIGKSVYEEIVPNKYISTLIVVDKSDPVPNKFEGTVAVGNGDTPLEATQCAVQWAYGYIQNCTVSDSSGNSVLKSESPTSSGHHLEAIHSKTADLNDVSSEASYESPKDSIEKEFDSANGIGQSNKLTLSSHNQKSDVYNTTTYSDSKNCNKDNLLVTSDSDPEENQIDFQSAILEAEKFCKSLDEMEERLEAKNSISLPAKIKKLELG